MGGLILGNHAGFRLGKTFSATPALDLITAMPAAAYSLRKLRTAYSGNCIRVRRTSDNTEQDIGFFGDVLDSAALLAFTGGSDGRVVTWYDQSSNGNNASQSTAGLQPRIVSSGVIDTQNNKPALFFTASSLNLGGEINSTNFSHFVVQGRSSTGTNLTTFAHNSADLPFTLYQYSDGIIYVGGRANYRFFASNTTGQRLYSDYSISDFITIYMNGVSQSTSVASGGLTTNFNTIGLRKGEYSSGFVAETFIFTSDVTSSRVMLESNLNSFYNLY